MHLHFGVLPAARERRDAVVQVGGDVTDSDDAIAVGVPAECFEKRLSEGAILPRSVLDRPFSCLGGAEDGDVRRN